ncbi:MAG: hypothetical protein PVI33_02310 [Candidatus Omnitrophota bacterium]|jgi:hypothetical protein
MLKRYQVLLNDWLADYIKVLAEKYDASFSEVIRLSLCMEYAHTIPLRYPGYKTKLNPKEIIRKVNKTAKLKQFKEEEHKLMSQVYFEARKAVEFALEKEKQSSR